MIKRLRRKFIIVNMAIVTVMLAVIFGLILFFTKSNMEQDNIQMLRSVSIMPMQPDMPDKAPQKTMPSVFAVYRTPDKEYSAWGSEVVDFSDSGLLSELYNKAMNEENETGILNEYNLRFHINHNPKHKAVFFADISGEIKTLRQLTYTCIFIAVLSLILFFAISVLLARWTVKPVETAWNQQKQFVADASHELKTPLTVIMTNAEMLLDENHTPQKRIQFSESILTMSKQMRGLTESLLELARSDNNSKEISFENIDFSALISEAVLPFEPLYFEKELTLICEIQDNIIVSGDSTQLCRLADILLDNAMKYSYPNTTVTVSLKKHRDYCIFSVSSHGDTISKTDLKNIFKRFYRVDKARSGNHSYGLGLSIAESIVKEHGGRIWAESDNGVNVFRVRLNIKL
ncbi:MAG: HAMP domain-containing histidine kinase [Ruminococcus sp.]|nr:HAMP domain-containing histidine kinase [Ruminococcus sp.]